MYLRLKCFVLRCAEMRIRMEWVAEGYAWSIAKALRIWAGIGAFSGWPTSDPWQKCGFCLIFCWGAQESRIDSG